ncbi:hypothetical protein PVT67_02675 [Gallaecimonas kandeliae]|uniref:hypothetical protein n=1 Tax=Gallaecimonas kandeliae TaxID=3029055 RepID=UPI002649CEF2|nr:hypothetical protein [Gallaecimonas kandeliae]WKE66170.1 hypothetical protein PVT67_02675 [Gallaecimonas kandeliae]
MGDYLNLMAVCLVGLAALTARKERRLPLMILANYAIYGLLVLLSDDYENGVLFGDQDVFGLWYLANALRDLVILAFVFEGLLKAHQGRLPYWGYLGVVSLSLATSLVLTLSDLTDNEYLGDMIFKVLYLTPFAEIALAWWGSDNILNRNYSTRPAGRHAVAIQ